MTLEEAIEILTDIKDEDPELYRDDEQDALKLGREALKLTLRLRADQTPMATQLLPGETKE